jgi:hypothetical protein
MKNFIISIRAHFQSRKHYDNFETVSFSIQKTHKCGSFFVQNQFKEIVTD